MHALKMVGWKVGQEKLFICLFLSLCPLSKATIFLIFEF